MQKKSHELNKWIGRKNGQKWKTGYYHILFTHNDVTKCKSMNLMSQNHLRINYNQLETHQNKYKPKQKWYGYYGSDQVLTDNDKVNNSNNQKRAIPYFFIHIKYTAF